MHQERSYKQHALGLMLIFFLLNALGFYNYEDPQFTVVYSSFVVSLCFIATVLFLPKPVPFLLKSQRYQVLTVLLSCFCVAIALILMFRVQYSRSTLLLGFIGSFIWIASIRFLNARQLSVVLHNFSNVDSNEFTDFGQISLTPCTEDFKITDIKSGLVSNFHKPLSDLDRKVLAECSLNDIPIYHSELIKERLYRKVSIDSIEPNSIRLFSTNRTYLKIKNITELSAIILFLPLIALLAIMITIFVKMNGRNEKIIFTQDRVGLHGKIFEMYKFRTMKGDELPDNSFATEQQQRIDKLGAFLRKTRLDEIPQFWNVLKGDMSIIGPRPEQPKLVEKYKKEIPYYGYRHSIKPGITGWAQIEQGYTDSTDTTIDKVSYDLYYIKNLNFQLDVYIALKTVRTVLYAEGV